MAHWNEPPPPQTPITITITDGLVSASGPDLAAVQMTPQVAIATGIRLIEAAAQAQGQSDVSASRGLRDQA
ncbi:MAG TPA: hypothetical protein VF649_14300 [Sphingomonas sp.]|jgi:hypothetical protein|uniref:hypothetical protein n=1 Tax=Sphingomonas sp. TaxID=28214 RepID=UPI002EDB96BA